MRILAHLISWIFLPFFMPIYGLILTMYIPSNQDFLFNEDNLYFIYHSNKQLLIYWFTFFIVIMPTISILILRRHGLISTIDIEDKRERPIPILVMFTYCLALFALLYSKSNMVTLPKYIYALPLAGMIVSLTSFGLNFWKKVSMHAAGGGILVGFLYAYFSEQMEFHYWVLVLAVIVSGFIASARIFLGRHTLSEVTLGWVNGAVVTFCSCYFIQ